MDNKRLDHALAVAKLMQDKRDNTRAQGLPAGHGPSRSSAKKRQRAVNEDDLLEALFDLQTRSKEILSRKILKPGLLSGFIPNPVRNKFYNPVQEKTSYIYPSPYIYSKASLLHNGWQRRLPIQVLHQALIMILRHFRGHLSDKRSGIH